MWISKMVLGAGYQSIYNGRSIAAAVSGLYSTNRPATTKENTAWQPTHKRQVHPLIPPIN